MEFVGSLPVLALGACVCVQALLIALSLVFAQLVAQRSAQGMDAAQARSVVPAAWRSRVLIDSTDRHAKVVVRTPSVLPGAAKLLRVSATSEVST